MNSEKAFTFANAYVFQLQKPILHIFLDSQVVSLIKVSSSFNANLLNRKRVRRASLFPWSSQYFF